MQVDAKGETTDLDRAASDRLKALLAAVNSGDAAVMQAFIDANGVSEPVPSGGYSPLPLVGKLLDLHRRSHGLEFVRMAKLEKGKATAVVQFRLTGHKHLLTIQVENAAPYRIANIPPALLVPTKLSLGSEAARFEHIGAYLDTVAEADLFSGVVLIARDGTAVFERAHGFADRERRIPNTIDTPFDIASTTKLFTSIAIGKLVEQGKLSYEDPLARFVPDFPDRQSAERIKIKHLLSHTAGLGNQFGPAYFNSIHELRSPQDVIDLVDREAPKFEPGEKWAYSNVGYLLLGLVIEAASGKTYYDYVRENLFAPAGMTSTSFPHQDQDAVVMAQRYDVKLDGQKLRYVKQEKYAQARGTSDGGSVSSAPDLIKFANALETGQIVKPETVRLHSDPKPELGSPKYGYGVMSIARTGEPLIGHGGNAPGVCTDFGSIPGTPYTVAVLSNSTMTSCIEVTSHILQALAVPKAA
ncbi:beta-lactamase family protein [Sphingomonas sabuli]|uniref:Beta-lactamase family protein n=1 Tax=Sphingomonas sabuli TaxID=2764186 RepID=A0A7G9L545_9SPHN|nr:serine hydrolase domain-containing protein [Sphingomonas sabuli]QNM83744.1 beta-lactamase family protein [Sphingomonas sabuli]